MARGKVWAALGYVRKARPKVVVIENVAEAGTVEPITGLVGRLEGYGKERSTTARGRCCVTLTRADRVAVMKRKAIVSTYTCTIRRSDGA